MHLSSSSRAFNNISASFCCQTRPTTCNNKVTLKLELRITAASRIAHSRRRFPLCNFSFSNHNNSILSSLPPIACCVIYFSLIPTASNAILPRTPIDNFSSICFIRKSILIPVIHSDSVCLPSNPYVIIEQADKSNAGSQRILEPWQ